VIIDAAMLIAVVYERSPWLAIIFGVLILFRHAPWFANAIASDLSLDERLDPDRYTGMDAWAIGVAAWVARVLLPAWDGARVIMSNDEDEEDENDRVAVVVPVPGSLVPPPQTPPDRDITRDGWIVKLALARDEDGDYMFSANQIDKAIGAHRATTLEKIKAVRANQPPAQFRQPDASTAPASYPVTKEQP